MIGLEHFPARVPAKSNHAFRHARESGHPVLRFGAVMAGRRPRGRVLLDCPLEPALGQREALIRVRAMTR
jgi:hypothetical protein